MSDQRPEDPDLQRAMRRHRIEARRQAREVEEAVGDLAANTQDMVEVFTALGRAGRPVGVDLVTSERFEGRIEHVGGALVGLRLTRGFGDQTGDQTGDRVMIAMDALVGVHADEAMDPRTVAITSGHPGSVVAHLRHLALSGEPVTLGRRGADVVAGVIRSVSNEVVETRATSGVWYLPVAAIAWTRTG